MHQLLNDFDFTEISETKCEPLFRKWLEVEENNRHKHEAIFRQIFDMGCKKGTTAIIDEITWQYGSTPQEKKQIISTLSSLKSHQARAMTVYLYYPECWKAANLFYHADTLSYWKKRKNLGSNFAKIDDKSIREFESMLANYFHEHEGKGNGKNCLVEVFKRNDLDYFFAYPEDHSKEQPEWKNNSLYRQPFNPAFEVVFVYSRKLGTLNINHKCSKKVLAALQKIFASSILGINELDDNQLNNHIFDLGPLANRSFDFTRDPAGKIIEVGIKEIRFTSKSCFSDQIILKCNPSENPKEIYHQIENMKKGIRLSSYKISQTELNIRISNDPGKEPKDCRVRLTTPNHFSLENDEHHDLIKAMLVASKLEIEDEKIEDTTVEPVF